MNRNETPIFCVCTEILSITNHRHHKRHALPAQRRERSRFRSSFLSFFLSFFLSLCLCEWWCRRHEQKLQRHARGDARVRGTVEVLLPENGRDLKFCVTALLSSSESDATTKHGLDECMTKKQLYLKCKRGQMDMRTRIRGNKGY